MHSRIFEVVEVRDGADYNSYMTESDFYDFIPSKFDYVNDDTDLENDIEWLKEYKPILFVGENVIETSKSIREKYFEKRFEKFKECAEAITLENFSSASIRTDYEKSLYNLQTLIRDEYGFYIWQDGLWSLDDWLRYCADEPCQFKIVGSMDYHW